MRGLGAAATRPLGLAVSGGGDSMAMLHLAVRAGIAVRVATVDHGLRPGSRAEAEAVARLCAGLGVPQAILTWQGWDGRGNLQARARAARRALLGDWAQREGLAAVALAHTSDDLAETLLMRLARGAGVDGLAAMAAEWQEGGVTFLRPLLAASRAGLRDYLAGIGADWIEDPSNAADRFDRVRARRALAALAPLGLGAPVLAEVAQHLGQARQALEAACDAAALRLVTETAGMVRIAAGFRGEPAEMRRRLIGRVLHWIAPAPYGPRGPAVQALLARLAAGGPAQLAGCHVLPAGQGLLVFREARAVAGLACPQDGRWDGRWRVEGPALAGGELRALGAAGLAQMPDWRSLGLPRAALLSLPALWQGGVLRAAPLLPQGQPGATTWRFLCDPPPIRLHHSVLSH